MTDWPALAAAAGTIIAGVGSARVFSRDPERDKLERDIQLWKDAPEAGKRELERAIKLRGAYLYERESHPTASQDRLAYVWLTWFAAFVLVCWMIIMLITPVDSLSSPAHWVLRVSGVVLELFIARRMVRLTRKNDRLRSKVRERLSVDARSRESNAGN